MTTPESDLNWFATILIAISFAAGVAVGAVLGPWSMPLAVIAAIVGAVAVHKFCKNGEQV